VLGDAALGIDLRPSLPEDRSDRQPLYAAGRFLLIADVRLDNRAELLAELGIDYGAPDAELLLAAWLRWQDRCFHKLVGDYAFAVWDQAERTLTLARDPTGQRPLFYKHWSGRTVFASTPAALIQANRSGELFDFAQLAATLTGRRNDGEETCFANVRRVRPGHGITIGPRGVSTWRHWWPSQDGLRLTDEGYVEAYRDRLKQAVEARLRRQSGLVAVHLSSGYDSSAVAAMAAQVSPGQKPTAFTAAPREGFDGPVPRGRIADESALAGLTARQHGLEHVVIRPSSGVLTGLREHCRLYQDPNFSLVNLEWLREVLAAAKALGVSTLLSGEMGNLTLHSGGLPVLAEWLRVGAMRRWWSEARAAAGSGQARWRGVLVNSFDARIPGALRDALERRFLGVPAIEERSFVRREWLDVTRHSSRHKTEAPYTGRYRGRFDMIAATDSGLFRKGSLAQFGIDERDPTADRRVLDFSFALPPEQLLHDGVWRPLARRALAGLLPPQVLDAPLRGCQGADWYERWGPGEALQLLEEITSSRAANELLDLDKMRAAIEGWPCGGWAESRQIMIYRTRLPMALVTGVFLQEFEALSLASPAS
jgi:asparagine synthase (glutamine-hydrolysing)